MVCATVLGVTVLGEVLTSAQIAGAVLVLLSVALAQTRASAPEVTHAS